MLTMHADQTTDVTRSDGCHLAVRLPPAFTVRLQLGMRRFGRPPTCEMAF